MFRDVLASIVGRPQGLNAAEATRKTELKEVRLATSRETLVIETWDEKRRYETFCKCVCMDVYLVRNGLIRDIFGMGDPVDFETLDAMAPKRQAKVIISYAF